MQKSPGHFISEQVCLRRANKGTRNRSLKREACQCEKWTLILSGARDQLVRASCCASTVIIMTHVQQRGILAPGSLSLSVCLSLFSLAALSGYLSDARRRFWLDRR